MLLTELPTRAHAFVVRVEDSKSNDTVSRRLRDLGFVQGEPVRIVARAPWGGDPMVIQVGMTRFALRIAEAARVHVSGEASHV